jgi:hypothetical protein
VIATTTTVGTPIPCSYRTGTITRPCAIARSTTAAWQDLGLVLQRQVHRDVVMALAANGPDH